MSSTIFRTSVSICRAVVRLRMLSRPPGFSGAPEARFSVDPFMALPFWLGQPLEGLPYSYHTFGDQGRAPGEKANRQITSAPHLQMRKERTAHFFPLRLFAFAGPPHGNDR